VDKVGAASSSELQEQPSAQGMRGTRTVVGAQENLLQNYLPMTDWDLAYGKRNSENFAEYAENKSQSYSNFQVTPS
jgi:hypothetical protein